MSTHRSHKQTEEPSTLAGGEDEPLQGITSGELTDPPSTSVDPQQSSKVFANEHPGDQNVRVHGPQTVPIRIQSPIGMAGAASTSAPSQGLSSDSGHNLSGAPDEGCMENEDGSFTIRASEVGRLCKEYADLMDLKENGEIVLMEAMEATERLNTMFNQIRTSMNRMSPMMKELFIVPKNTPSVAQVIQGIPESIERSQCSMGETQSIDMNALREEIKETISSTIKEKLHSDADSITTVSQSMTALDANAQYWSDLSNKVAHCSCRVFELQLKMAEEKVNILLHKEAPKEVLLEAAWEAHTIHFQLDQNTHLRKAGLIPEQQVRFRTDTGGKVNNPSRDTPALSMTAQLDGAAVNRMTEYSGIQQMVRQAVQNASHEAEPEKSFLAKAGVKMGNPPTYSGEHNLEKFENWVVSVLQFMSMYNFPGPRVGKVQLQFLEIKHWDLESVIMGLQRWFMPTLLMNKVAVNYDTIMQDSMTVQQLHQELLKLAKQMIELPDAYSYRRRFMNVLKPDIREQALRKGFTPKFSGIDELVDEAVTFDNAKCYTSGYNSNHGSSYLQKAAAVEHSRVQHTTTQNKSSTNQNAGSSKQHKHGNKLIQNCQTTQSLSTGGGDVRVNPTCNPIRTTVKANNTVVCYNCNQPGHIRPNYPFPDKARRVAGATIEEVILEEFDKDAPHPEEQQDWEDQPEEDDQQYCFNDDKYETRSIDNEVVCVNAVIKDSGYNDHHRLYGIRVREIETDLRVSAVVQTGEKEQPVYDH
ncbi:hypothetical protein M422DRAFT_243720 [Sphaerobolus stellatus SS14]|nr:hypothetical protein M422DRAFT_243720 [Sphaerobolus stellatus SS14]